MGVTVAMRRPHSLATITVVPVNGQRRRQPAVADVLLEPGGVDRRGHLPDRPVLDVGRPLGEVQRREGIPVDFDPDDPALHSPVANALQRRHRGAFPRHVEVHQPLEPHLERVVLVRHVGAPVEDSALDPADVAGAGGPDVVGRAGLENPLPELGAPRRVEQVHLVADLGGPAGAGDDHRDAVHLGLAEEVVLEVEDLLRRRGRAPRRGPWAPGSGGGGTPPRGSGHRAPCCPPGPWRRTGRRSRPGRTRTCPRSSGSSPGHSGCRRPPRRAARTWPGPPRTSTGRAASSAAPAGIRPCPTPRGTAPPPHPTASRD